MGITLITCVLAMTMSALARTDTKNCSKLCKVLMDHRVETRPRNCDCSYEDNIFFRTTELDDHGIYFEPSDVYALQPVSFISPPFYILNPTLKLNRHLTVSKIIKKRKLPHNNKYPSHIKTQASVNIATHDNEAHTQPLYLDIDLQEPSHPNGDTLSHKYIKNNRIRFELSEKFFMDCINLYMSAYSMKSSSTYKPEFKEISHYGKDVIESEILKDIKKKCSQPADVVRQSLREIKNMFQNKIKSSKIIKPFSSDAETVKTSHISSHHENKKNNGTDYPNTLLFQHQEDAFGNTPEIIKYDHSNRNEFTNSLNQSTKFKVVEDLLISHKLPDILKTSDGIWNSQKLKDKYYTTEHTPSTTFQNFEVNLNNSDNVNKFITKNNYDKWQTIETNNSNFNNEREKEIPLENEHSVVTMNILTTEETIRDISEDYFDVKHNENISKEEVDNQEGKNILFEVEASNPMESIITPLKSENRVILSTESNKMETDKIDLINYDSTTGKSEINYEDLENNNQTHSNNLHEFYDPAELHAIAEQTAVISRQQPLINSDNTLTEEDKDGRSNIPGQKFDSMMGEDTQIPSNYFVPSSEKPIEISDSKKTGNVGNFSNEINTNEQKWQVNSGTGKEYSNYYGSNTTTKIPIAREKVFKSNEDSPIYKTVYDAIIREDFSNISVPSRSIEISDNNSYHTNNLLSNTDRNVSNLTSSITPKKTTIPYMLKEGQTSTTTDWYKANSPLTIKHSTDNILSSVKREYNKTLLHNMPKKEFIHSSKVYTPEENIIRRYYNRNIITDLNETSSVSLIPINKISNENIVQLTLFDATDATERPELVTKEFQNNSVVSTLNTIKFVGSESYSENSSEYNILSARGDRAVQRIVQENEHMDSDSITGKMYFVFNNTSIPAKFIQKENGELSLGLDGLTLCTKLHTKSKPSLLINMICNCFSYQNCTNSQT